MSTSVRKVTAARATYQTAGDAVRRRTFLHETQTESKKALEAMLLFEKILALRLARGAPINDMVRDPERVYAQYRAAITTPNYSRNDI